MNNPDDEIGIGEGEGDGEGVGEAQAEGPDLESKFSPTPIVGNNNPCDSQTSCVNNV